MQTIRKDLGWLGRPIVFLALLWAIPALAQEVVQAPVYKDGDFWQFRVEEWDFISQSTETLNGDWEVVYSGGKLQTFRLEGDKKVEMDVSYVGPITLSDLLGATQGKREYLRFPLIVGPKDKIAWEANYRNKARGARRDYPRDAYHSVIAVKKLTVPAGTFNVLEIHRDYVGGSPPGSRWKSEYYYSPETGSIVSLFHDQSVGTGRAKIRITLLKYGRRP